MTCTYSSIRTSSFTRDEIQREEKAAHAAALLRQRTRDAMRISSDPYERLAVALAEQGYGIGVVVYRSGVSDDLARKLVLGK